MSLFYLGIGVTHVEIANMRPDTSFFLLPLSVINF